MKILELKIKGMTCASCSTSVEKLVDNLNGIQAKYINHVTDKGKIEFDENVISQEEIISKINEGHYKVIGFENIKNKIKVPLCPKCSQSGQLVPNSVFKSNLKVENFKKVNLEIENYICQNPTCNVAYYNSETTIDKSELKRELWFKNGSKRKVICYCNNIDKDQIKESVTQHNQTTWEEITSHYRKTVIEKCEILNPTGHCCREKFNEVINKFK